MLIGLAAFPDVSSATVHRDRRIASVAGAPGTGQSRSFRPGAEQSVPPTATPPPQSSARIPMQALAQSFSVPGGNSGRPSCSAGATGIAVGPPHFSGSVGFGVISRSLPESESELILQGLADVNADTYFWHPWFATLNGGGAVAYERHSGHTGNEGDAVRFSGDLTLNILPQSRFPASVSFSRLDNRVSGGFVGADFVQNRLSFNTRSVLTSSLRTTLGGALDWSEQSRTGDRRGQSFYGGVTKTFKPNAVGVTSMAASVNYSASDFDSLREGHLSEETLTGNLSVQMAPSDTVRNSLVLSYVKDEDASPTAVSDRTSLVAVDSFTWNPRKQIFNVDGLVRVRKEENDFADTHGSGPRRNDQYLTFVNMGLPINDNLSFRVGFRGGIEDRDGTAASSGGGPLSGRREFAAVNGSANYVSDSRKFGKNEWRWGARGAGEAGYASHDELLRKPNAALFQVLERDIGFFGSKGARITLSQEVGVDAGAIDRDTHDRPDFVPIASHGATFAYTNAGVGSTTTLSANARDMRELTGTRNELQTAQIRFDRRQAIGARRTFTGFLTANLVRRRLNNDTDWFVMATGRLVYAEQDIFGVPNWGFRSEAAVNIFEIEELFTEDPTPTEGEDLQHHEWRNIMTYRIGKIALIGEVSGFYEDEGFGSLLMFRIQRHFGAN